MSSEGPKTPFVRVGRGEYALKSIVDSGDRSELDKVQSLMKRQLVVLTRSAFTGRGAL